MIDFLRGRVAHVEADSIVLDTGSVGYRVYCANPYAFPIQAEEVIVYIYDHVREDAHLLFGFATREEQKLFAKLLDVNGVGPKVAIGMLAGTTADALVAAIRSEDATSLSRLPGIGKKTAQRMILDLKDKLDDFSTGAVANVQSLPVQEKAVAVGAWAEAKEALKALGYKEAELQRAWDELAEEAAELTVDELMKLALKVLYKG